MKKILLLFVIVCNLSLVYGQNYTIKGKVLDAKNKEKLIYANCVLHYSTDSLGIYKGEVSDTNGEYVIKRVKPRDLILEISYVGYKTYKRRIQKEEFKDKVLNIEDIYLEMDVALQGVEIVAKRKLIEIDDDKMRVNVDEQMASTVDNAFDLLKLVPGVVIDNQENIKLNGKSGVQFQYNGRQLKMSWSALKDMLKSMSPDMVDQFEVLTNPGVKYDAEGTAGIINIKIKKNQHYGINGSVGITSSMRDKGTYGYTPSGRLNFVNDKWIVSLGVSFREGFSQREAGKDSSYRYTWINETDTTFFRSIDSGYSNNYTSPSLDFSASYSLDSLSTLSLAANYHHSNTPFYSTNSFVDILQNPYLAIDSMYHTYSGNKNHSQNTSFSLGYVRQIDTLDSKLSSDLDFQYNSSYSNDISQVSYYQTNQMIEDNLLREQGYNRINDDKSYNLSWRADLYKVFNKKMKFEAGIKSQYSFDDRDYSSLIKQDGQYINNPYETNRFKYHENINSLYASFTAKFFNNKLSLRSGLRLEQTNTKGEQTNVDSINTRHYFNVFPSIRLAYKFADDNEIVANYSYRISRPWSNSLNPFIEKQSDYSFSTGNPYLEPQYTHYVSLGHSFKYALFSSISYSHTNNNIKYISTPIDSTYSFTHSELALINSPVNLGSSESFSFNLSFNKSIISAWYLGIFSTISYDKTNSFGLKEKVSREGWSYNLNVNSFVSLPYKIRLNLYYMFYSASYVGISTGYSWQYLWAGLGKSFFDDSFSVNLSCNWSLNQTSHSKTEYMNYITEYWQAPYRPYWNLSFRYRFGKFYQNKQVKKMQLQDFDSRTSGQNSRG